MKSSRIASRLRLRTWEVATDPPIWLSDRTLVSTAEPSSVCAFAEISVS